VTTLKVDGIAKRFGERTVLNNITFTVPGGRLTGFVGGNGAGKTTTMRIILGVLEADAGQVFLDDTRLVGGNRGRFGYMPEERGLYPKMRVLEQLVYLARLHGLSAAAATRNATALVERLGLGERKDEDIEKLSLGNQQRVQIAASLVHDPEVLVLDEPFSGLDPMAVNVVVDVLRERAAQGVPVLFSSHQLDVVERLCDDVVIIAGGEIRAAGPREELRSRFAGERIAITLAGDAGWLRSEPGVTVVEFEGDHALVELDGITPDALLRTALDRGGVVAFTPHRPHLAEIFQEVVR